MLKILTEMITNFAFVFRSLRDLEDPKPHNFRVL